MKSAGVAALDAALKSEFAPVLCDDGFRGSGRTFRQLRGELIHVVNVQGSKYGDAFAVNLGVHLTFLPHTIGRPVDSRTITESLCEFRRGMSAHGADQWWSYEADPASALAAVQSAVAVWRSHGSRQLETLGRYLEDFAELTADDLKSGSRDFMGGLAMPTQVRLALTFARIRLHEGRVVEAQDFARFGLQNLGQAFALRPEFERVLARSV